MGEQNFMWLSAGGKLISHGARDVICLVRDMGRERGKGGGCRQTERERVRIVQIVHPLHFHFSIILFRQNVLKKSH